MNNAKARPRVGFVGLGRMGVRMAKHVADAGFDLTVHNRTSTAAQRFAEAHATSWAPTARDVGDTCSVIVMMVADGPALIELIEGQEGLAVGLSPGDVVVDMGTTGVHHTGVARSLLGDVGVELVEAPVSGSIAAAEARSLLVMAGGDPAALSKALPVLEAIADNVVLVGGPGTGAAMKLAVNAVLYGINQAVAESLVLAEQAGIPRSVAYDVFVASAVAAPVVLYRRAVFEDPEGTPVTFSVDLAVKDLGLILGLAAALSSPMPQTEVNHRVLSDMATDGRGNADMGEAAVHLREL